MHGDGEELNDAASWSPIDSHEWYAARNAVMALRDVLIAAGLHQDFPCLRADLNAFGQGAFSNLSLGWSDKPLQVWWGLDSLRSRCCIGPGECEFEVVDSVG